MSQLPSLTYENLAASSGRLASLLSANGSSDGSSSNEYYEEVAFRNGVASKAATRHNEPPDATEDQDDDQVRSSLQGLFPLEYPWGLLGRSCTRSPWQLCWFCIPLIPCLLRPMVLCNANKMGRVRGQACGSSDPNFTHISSITNSSITLGNVDSVSDILK